MNPLLLEYCLEGILAKENSRITLVHPTVSYFHEKNFQK